MEKMDWSNFFMEVFNLLFEKKIQKATEVIEKQRLVMGLPALSSEDREIFEQVEGYFERACLYIERTDSIQKSYIKHEEELATLKKQAKHWKYKLPFFSLKSIELKKQEVKWTVECLNEELQSPQAPHEWQHMRSSYEKLASLFGFNEEWVDKIANISQIVDSFQAKLIR